MTFLTYKDISNQIEAFEVSKSKKIGALIGSMIISAIIILIPLFTLINLLIFRDFIKLIIVGFGFLAWFYYFLTEALYYQAITRGNVKKVHIVAFCDSLLFLIIIFAAILLANKIGGF